MSNVDHNILSNSLTNATLHNLHSPGYVTTYANILTITTQSAGDLAYATDTGLYYYWDAVTSSWAIINSTASAMFLPSQSSNTSVSTPNIWYIQTGNSITLTPGTWAINGVGNFGGGGFWINVIGQWSTANGTGTSTPPTILSPKYGIAQIAVENTGTTSFYSYNMVMSQVIVAVASNTNIYLNLSGDLTNSPANVSTYIYAQYLSTATS